LNKSDKEVELYNLIQAMKEEALEKGFFINLFYLMDENAEYFDKINGIFGRAKEIAKQYSIEVFLPAIRPETERRFAFTEDNSMFIPWDGMVSPYYFLWHRYDAIRQGYVEKCNTSVFWKPA
jgi:hypothetical protein